MIKKIKVKTLEEKAKENITKKNSKVNSHNSTVTEVDKTNDTVINDSVQDVIAEDKTDKITVTKEWLANTFLEFNNYPDELKDKLINSCLHQIVDKDINDTKNTLDNHKNVLNDIICNFDKEIIQVSDEDLNKLFEQIKKHIDEVPNGNYLEKLYEKGKTLLENTPEIETKQTYKNSQFDNEHNRLKTTPKEDIHNSLKNAKKVLEELNEIKSNNNNKTNIIQNNNINNNNYENVNHPKHYNTYDIEVIDMMERIWGPEKTAIFCQLNAFKYRMRMGTKPTSPVKEDLDKEMWYIKKYNELKTKL